MATCNEVQVADITKPFLKTGVVTGAIAAALSFFTPVSQASVDNYQVNQRTAPVAVSASRKSVVQVAVDKARECADIFEKACVELASAPTQGWAKHEAFAQVADDLRTWESKLDEIMEALGMDTAEEYSLTQLRRELARARSRAATAEMLAKQTTAMPKVLDSRSSEDALNALADHTTSRIGAHLNGKEALRS
jgi:hypothetical protein